MYKNYFLFTRKEKAKILLQFQSLKKFGLIVYSIVSYTFIDIFLKLVEVEDEIKAKYQFIVKSKSRSL